MFRDLFENCAATPSGDQRANKKLDVMSQFTAPAARTLGGVNAEVAFGGLTPDFVGLMQVNIKIPNLAPIHW
jgi:uncharacterized protein (TIGR03437 family)